MDIRYPYIRQIKPDELADFLNSKGGTQESFKCPICGNLHQSLIDNMLINDDKSTLNIALQSVLPAFVYPNSASLKNAIDKKDYPNHYEQFTNGETLGLVNQYTYREVIHLICENCGYIRSFSKNINWLIQEGKFDE